MPKPRNNQDDGGRFAYEGLDRVMHEKARLGIMTSLASAPKGLLFGELKTLCSLTDGNLSRHIQTLEEAGLVEVWKGFEKRRPQTLCRLSTKGRERFMAYLAELERVVRDAKAIKQAAAKADKPDDLPEGWVPA